MLGKSNVWTNNISGFFKHLPWAMHWIIILHVFGLLDQKQLILMKHLGLKKKSEWLLNRMGSSPSKTKQLAELWGQAWGNWRALCNYKAKLGTNHRRWGAQRASGPAPHWAGFCALSLRVSSFTEWMDSAPAECQPLVLEGHRAH